MSERLSVGAPFVGLRPFEHADHQWFYGREKETAALTRQVRGSRFTAVVGASGSGKSSLVRAGVLVELTRDGWLPIITKPGSAPIAKLAAAFSERARDPEEDRLADARSYRFGAALRASAYGLAEIVEKLAPDAPHLILVVDQFEELFRYGEEIPGMHKAALQEESRAFVELLLTAAAHGGGRLHVLITMRSDYFGKCTGYAGLAEAVSASQYLVPLPSRDQLELAIRRPVERGGGKIDGGLVQRLLIDVEDQVDRLPVLQQALRRLWDLSTGEPRHLSEASYVAVGGLDGSMGGLVSSIDRQAEEVLAAVVSVRNEDGGTLERVMKALTNLDEHDRATRRPLSRSALLALLGNDSETDAAPAESLARVLEALRAEGTSFVQVGETEDPEVDIGHEALIRRWKRLAGEKLDFKSGWLREEREDGEEWRGLVRRAEAGRRLGVGEQRRIARWMRARRFTPAWSKRYGNAWDAVATMCRRSGWFSVMAGLALGALLAALLFVGGHLLQRQRQAEAEALRQARAGALAAAVSARSFTDQGDARIGALLALGVVPESRLTDDLRYLPEVESALAHALSNPIDRARLRGHDKAVWGVAFSPDGRRLASASEDGTLRLWDAGTGQPIGQRLRGHDGAVSSVAFSMDGRWLASASVDRTVRLWDAHTGQPIGQPLRGHRKAVWGVTFSPDGRRLVSASEDETLQLWDTGTGQPIGGPLRGHEKAVDDVAFSPDGRRLVSASEDMTLRLWDAGTGQPIGQPLRGHDKAVASVAFSPDGGRLASASIDRTVRLWDASTGQPIGQPLRGHDKAVASVAFSPDGGRLVSASADATLRLWDAGTGQPIGRPLRGHDKAIWGVAFSPDGRWLASVSADATLRLWDVGTGQPIGQPLRGHDDAVNGVAFSPDGRRLASVSGDATLRLWDAGTGQPTGQPLRGHDGAVSGVAFSPDGQRLASASTDKTLRLWDAGTGEPIGRPLRGHERAVTRVAFSPDGRRLASASEDTTLRLWDADTGQAIGQPLRGHREAVSGVVFSPDGRRLASTSWDGTLRLWDAGTGRAIGQPLRGHDLTVSGVAFSPDGRRLVSASQDMTLRLWDAWTGQPIGQPLHGHDGAVSAVAFSSDGRRLASGSADRTLRLWDAWTGQAIGQPVRGHDGAVSGVAFSPDGRRLASASADRTLRLWDAREFTAPHAKLVESAEGLCPLSRGERELLHIFDPRFAAHERNLTDAQRQACGEPVSIAP